jgi:hypothetical protein
MTLSDEFNQRILTLRNVHFDDATGRLIALLEWLESEPVTKALLDELTAKVDVEKLFKGAGFHRRPRADTRDEIAAVGVQLIRECREHPAPFFKICFALNIRGPYHSGNFQDANDAGLREYVVPFLEYIEGGLMHAAAHYSPDAIANNRVAELLSDPFSKLLPRTAANLNRLAGEFLRPEAEVAWQNVGNSCRQALIEFASEIHETSGFELPPDIEVANVKGLLKHIGGRIFGEGRFRDTLLTLVDAVWNHAQSITHRSAASKEDALRAFLWTGLVISEFVRPLQAHLEG